MIGKAHLLIASSALLLLVLPVACTPAEDNTPPPPPPPVADSSEAGKLFATNCSPCHGADRMGSPNVAPALFLYGIKDDDIRTTITKGVNGTAMPAFGDRLSTAEIDALVKFLKTQPAGK